MKRLLLILLATLGGCAPSAVVAPPDNRSETAVLVTVPPIADLVRRVAGDSASVSILVPAGKEPETFAPSPSDVMKIANCDFFFRVGLATETPLLKRLKSVNPKMKIVDLRENLPRLDKIPPVAVASPDEKTSDHDPHDGEREHDHPASDDPHHPDHAPGHHDCADDGIDPHIWMSPSNLIFMATIIERELSSKNPEKAEKYRTNSDRFRREVKTLQSETVDRLAPVTSRTLYVFHPAYGYYCQEFGLEQRAIEAGGKSPKSKDLVELIRKIQEEKADKIFVQPEFNQTAVQKIAEAVSISVAVHSPLGEDCLKNIRELTDRIVQPKAAPIADR